MHVVCAKLGKTILIDEDTVIEAVAGATKHVASSCELAGPAATEPIIAMGMPVKLVCTCCLATCALFLSDARQLTPYFSA